MWLATEKFRKRKVLGAFLRERAKLFWNFFYFRNFILFYFFQHHSTILAMDEHLIKTVNKLQDAFSTVGVHNPVDLPQIVVIGR